MDFYSLQNNSITDLQDREHAGKFHGKVLATVVREKGLHSYLKNWTWRYGPGKCKAGLYYLFNLLRR